jgi:hypothetical protein
MTEAEWLVCEDLRKVLNWLAKKASQRKLRLLGCVACRRAQTYLTPEFSHLLVAAEGAADTQPDLENMTSLYKKAKSDLTERIPFKTNLPSTQYAVIQACESARWCAAPKITERAIRDACGCAAIAVVHGEKTITKQRNNRFLDEYRAICRYVRDIFGNPFHPITLKRSWLTSKVLALANSIYEERAFDRMPILANALQNSGCDNEDILNHCRQQGEHCRGCWVVDLLLGKS